MNVRSDCIKFKGPFESIHNSFCMKCTFYFMYSTYFVQMVWAIRISAYCPQYILQIDGKVVPY